MKKILLFVLFIISFSFLSIQTADAHVLVTDGNIGAVLHIDPDDAPVAKQQSAFFFEFKDTQNKFQPKNCDCTFSIIENVNTIYSQPLFANNTSPSLSNASVFYTFSQEDVYQVQVVGKPNTPNAFQPFTLVYNVRVDQIANTPTSQTPNWFVSHIGYVIIAGILVLAIISFFLSRLFKRDDGIKEGGGKHDKENNSNKY